MSVGLENFRQARGGFLEREIEITLDKSDQGRASEPAVRQSGQSRLTARLGGWISSKLSGPQSQERVEQREQARVGVKREFLELLRRTEGSEAAKRALQECSLPEDWGTNVRPLTNQQVGQILDKTREIRKDVMDHNDVTLSNARTTFDTSGFDVLMAMSQAVKMDARYGCEKLSPADVRRLCEDTREHMSAVHLQQCQERFPALSAFVQNADSPFGTMKDLRPDTLVDRLRLACTSPLNEFLPRPVHEDLKLSSADALWISLSCRDSPRNLSKVFRPPSALRQAFEQLEHTDELLKRQAWNIGSLWALSFAIERQVQELEQVITALKSASEPSESKQELQELPEPQELPPPKPEKPFYDALRADIERQIPLLQAKRAYVDEMRLINPLTDRAVEHSNLVWMHAGRSLLDRLDQMVQQDQVLLTGDQKAALEDVKRRWANASIVRAHEYNRGHEKLDALRSIPASSKGNRATHPIVQGKRDLLRGLYNELDRAGIPWTTLNELFSKSSLKQAERAALSTIQTWQPVTRDMPVMRDGALRTYRSEIVPAHVFDPRVGGVPSSARDSADHARNLKVSRLSDPSGQVMTTVIGHGVLDMWGIPEAAQRRQANQQGAREVLELALANNGRLMAGLTGPRSADAQPPRLVHVSVNLVSPESVLGLFPSRQDRQEKNHALNQFQAFEDNSGPGQTLRLLNGDPLDEQTVTVNVDTITFSFGVNGMGMGAKHLLGGWGDVHAHNTRNMIKLIGYLGEGRFGAQGVTPGGFIGEVHDRLLKLRGSSESAAADVEKAEALLGQLRGQTDLVRALFSEEAFRQGKGDTVRMGREILMLQSLAEQGLALVGATDLAATMSKGSKHDLDRGGFTDVELKTKLILRDLGGDMRPDERLHGDDQGVYDVVSAASGQLENQRWNTGLPGSKAADRQAFRLPDPEVRQTLTRLKKFVLRPV